MAAKLKPKKRPAPTTRPVKTQSGVTRTTAALEDRLGQGTAMDQDQPQAWETGLDLTPEQSSRLVDYVLRRFDDLETETGRLVVPGTTGYIAGQTRSASAAQEALNLTAQQSAMFFPKRARYERYFDGDVSDRAEPNTIYERTNLTASLAERVTRQMIGRAKNRLFATDPWMAAVPEGDDDEQRADKIGKYINHKAQQARLKEVFHEAIDCAFVRNEAILKTRYVERAKRYRRKTAVAVKSAGGDPIFDSEGGYIMQSSPWDMTQGVDPMSGNPIQQWTLRRDPSVVRQAQPVFEKREIVLERVLYRGPETSVVHYEDFLAPLTAANLEQADIAMHLYDMDAMSVARQFIVGRPDVGQTMEKRVADVDRAADSIRSTLSADRGQFEAAASQPNASRGENTTTPGQDRPSLLIVEAWLTYDANEDGDEESIVVVIDKRNRRLLFADFDCNVSATGMRCFTCIRPLPVTGRWYGKGGMEFLWNEQKAADLFLNRWSFAVSDSGAVTFWDPSATVEGDMDKNLKYNAGVTYTLKPGKKADDALQRIHLSNQEKTAEMVQMLQFFQQLMQLKSGTVMAGDEAVSDMNSSKLATGIRNMERAGDDLFASWMPELARGIEEAAYQFAMTALANIDRRETFLLFDGNDSELIEIEPSDVADVNLNVRLTLSRTEGERLLSQWQFAMGVVQFFYSLAPEVQQNIAPMAKRALILVDVKNVDQVIVPLQPLPPAPPAIDGFTPPAQSAGGAEQQTLPTPPDLL